MSEIWVIMKSGKVLDNRFFTSDDSARNYIKMTYPKRRFKEISDNVFLDKNFGAKFTIIELSMI